ncbi:MAG: hypothetical protein JXB32_07060 [Deltaproteobacteria bacterium]|nr:hypothetical protein [Deltaproteobacteria bacterium]
MGNRTVGWIVLLAAGCLSAAGCKLTEDEAAAVEACRKHGNAGEPCRMANRMLASGAGKVGQALAAEEQARQRAEQELAAAAAREQELAAQGVDPCEELAKRLTAEHPAAACAGKVAEAVEWLKSDPGCAAALGDPEGTAMTAADLLGDCDGE